MMSRSTVRAALASAMLATTSLAAVGLTAASAQPAAAPPAADAPRRAGGSAAAAAVPEVKAPTQAERPDLYRLPPMPNYTPKKTAWGDPDLRGTWPIDSLGGLPMQRTASQGNRVFLTDEEYAVREKAMERSRNAAATETKANKLGMGNWVEMTGAGRRTSLLIDPPNGRLPELTEAGKKAQATGRSSWVRDQTYDWVDDFDSWDRCVTRGFPASMMPFRYNNGIRIFQSPGYVTIALEMLGTRVIPIDNKGMAPVSPVKSWMGESHGHWEGNTLVIETTNIRHGAAPINMATIGGLPNNTLQMSDQAKVVERLTMADPNTLVYTMTYSDPVYFTAPWTIREDWTRNEKYEFYEYACHEGNVQVRNYINSSRAQRAQAQAGGGAAPAGAASPAAPAQSGGATRGRSE